MRSGERFLRPDVIRWLLEPENPSVRHAALTELCDGRPDDEDARRSREAIMETGAVPAILALQAADGFWGEADRFYHAKYTGTVWQVLILAELGADPADPRIRKACEYILENSQDLESGGFSIHRSARKGGGRHHEVIPCLTGNMTWGLLRLGYHDDPRVKRAIEWITTYQRTDDGVETAPTGWPYEAAEPCWGRHTCHMGVIKAMKALAEIPEASRTPAIQQSLDDQVEYVLRHHIHKRSHNPSLVSKPGWLRFGFPLMYQTDILEILGILTALGVRDPRMDEAIEVLVSKRDTTGRWKLASTFNDKFLVPIEAKGQPSKWITFRALRVLKTYTNEPTPETNR